ncbi:unnamed protein product, partial [Adineta ricciae]
MECDPHDHDLMDISGCMKQTNSESVQSHSTSSVPTKSFCIVNSPTFTIKSSENHAFNSRDNCLKLENILIVMEHSSSINSLETTAKQSTTPTQSLSNIQMFVQPKQNQRPCYASDFKDKPPRYIRGVHKELNRKTYDYPAVRIPDNYLNSNRIFYIRVSLVTVELADGNRYIHP